MDSNHRRPGRPDLTGPHQLVARLRAFAADRSGVVLVEAAFALPIMIVMLVGSMTYASWFMAAHSVQEAADEAARAALPGLSQSERDGLATQAMNQATSGNSTLDPRLVKVSTALKGNYYSVTVTYDVAHSALFQTLLVPPPGQTIVRSAVVQLASV